MLCRGRRAFFVYTYVHRNEEGQGKMKKEKSFKEELMLLLSSPASEQEKETLKDLSISLKKPTRMTVLAAAIYKKAASGDLSSLKEIISTLGEEKSGTERVILLDDIPKQN